MKVKMHFLVLKFSSKEVKDFHRHSIIRIGIWCELDAVEIRVRQVIQLFTFLFNEIPLDLMPKFFESLCKEFHIISNTALSGILITCYETNSQLIECIFLNTFLNCFVCFGDRADMIYGCFQLFAFNRAFLLSPLFMV